MNRTALGMFFWAAFPGLGNALAAPGQQAEIRELRMQVEALLRQNEALSRRLEHLERDVAAQHDLIQTQEETIEYQAESTSRVEEALKTIGDRVTIHGDIDIELSFVDWYGGERTSEITIDSVEVELEVEFAEWARGLALFTIDERKAYVDEAYLTLGETDDMSGFLKVGKMVAPFGDFSSNMIQTPFTQTLGEINEGAGVLGWSGGGVTASVFAYDGLDETGDDAQLNGLGAAVRYEREAEDGLSFSVGVGIVNNLASADGVSDMLPRTEDDEARLIDTAGGFNVHAGANFYGFSAIAEHTTALGRFHADDLAFGGTGARPSALNAELAWTTEIADHETTFAAAFQKTWEAVALYLPEFRYSASVAVTLADGLTLTLEGFIDRDYDESEDGTGDDGYGVTTQMSYEF